MTLGEWLNTISGGVTMLGVWITLAALIIGGWSSRTAKRLQADIHTTTQLTLADMRKGFQESQERLGQGLAAGQTAMAEGHQTLGEAVKEVGVAVKAVGDGVAQLGQILERLDQRLDRMDERWAQAFERMDQRADERHRETIQAIQALRG